MKGDEHEEALATFKDARNVFNNVRQARGFFPVVALDSDYENKEGKSKEFLYNYACLARISFSNNVFNKDILASFTNTHI